MDELLLDDETLAELRSLEVGGMPAVATIVRDEATIASSVPFSVQPAIISASGMRMQPAIPGLGGGRATHIGFMPWGTDVLEGDTVQSGGRTYAVEGVGDLLTSIGLALSEVRG